jgi:hypothetical protein
VEPVSRTARETELLERIASALDKLVAQNEEPSETVDVKGAAALLHTTPRAIYQRRHAGQMPTPVSRRPLVWRKADLLRVPK